MLWRFKTETLLKARDLWSLVSGNDQKPINTNVLTSYTKQENHTLNLIVQSLLDSQLMLVCQNTIAKGVWEALAKRHINKFLFLTCRFFNSQMNSNETMKQHINKLNVMAKELNAIGTKVPLR
jgi:hypothetical protein